MEESTTVRKRDVFGDCILFVGSISLFLFGFSVDTFGIISTLAIGIILICAEVMCKTLFARIGNKKKHRVLPVAEPGNERRVDNRLLEEQDREVVSNIAKRFSSFFLNVSQGLFTAFNLTGSATILSRFGEGTLSTVIVGSSIIGGFVVLTLLPSRVQRYIRIAGVAALGLGSALLIADSITATTSESTEFEVPLSLYRACAPFVLGFHGWGSTSAITRRLSPVDQRFAPLLVAGAQAALLGVGTLLGSLTQAGGPKLYTLLLAPRHTPVHASTFMLNAARCVIPAGLLCTSLNARPYGSLLWNGKDIIPFLMKAFAVGFALLSTVGQTKTLIYHIVFIGCLCFPINMCAFFARKLFLISSRPRFPLLVMAVVSVLLLLIYILHLGYSMTEEAHMPLMSAAREWIS